MTSPLDCRIRVIARDELQSLVGGVAVEGDVGGVEQQLADLHEHLHRALTEVQRLTDRVAALESSAADPAPARRGRQKPAADA